METKRREKQEKKKKKKKRGHDYNSLIQLNCNDNKLQSHIVYKTNGPISP